eukprot:m.49573 g.49573  ORF g.49573 m.49573 type:complete len:55 (-) comp47974_c0_seq2:796-960(-)
MGPLHCAVFVCVVGISTRTLCGQVLSRSFVGSSSSFSLRRASFAAPLECDQLTV